MIARSSEGKKLPPWCEELDLTQFWKTVARSPLSALLLDYDGTLAPFHRKRDRAFPYPGVALLLQEIVRSNRTRVVVISGRDASNVMPLLGIHPHPEIWGLHGLQRLRPDGSAEMSILDQRTREALSDADLWLTHEELRHTAEFKAGSIAVHWRGLSEEEAADIRDRVTRGWRPIADRTGAHLLEFDGGLEIRTPEPDKGDAVRAILKELGPDAPAAYLGDDVTDEKGFVALGARGLSILVRPKRRHSSAQMWLRPPEELLTFLKNWLHACEGEPEPRPQTTAHCETS